MIVALRLAFSVSTPSDLTALSIWWYTLIGQSTAAFLVNVFCFIMTTYYHVTANPELTKKELDEKLGKVSNWRELYLKAFEALTHGDERYRDAVQRRIP